MNPPPKDRQLSIGLLHDALSSFHNETRNSLVPYTRLVLNEEGWRPVMEKWEVQFSRGVYASLVSSKAIGVLLNAALVSNFGYGPNSAYMFPAYDCDQSLVLEVDFGYETTRKVEDLLRSGRVSIIPCDGDYQWGYTATVAKNEGHRLLQELIAPGGHDGWWSLRGNISIRARDGSITIVSRHGCPTDPGRELSAELSERYGVPIDTTGLRNRTNYHLEYALRHEKRAAHFEKLNKKA